jgi:hypothetical protein
MDGATLARLAHILGLAPDSVQPFCGIDDFLYDYGARQPWEPHIDLAQADAVLRTLRAYGWSILQEWDGGRACGIVEVTWGAPQGDAVPRAYACANHRGHDEAHALLLVACLARAAQVGEKKA